LRLGYSLVALFGFSFSMRRVRAVLNRLWSSVFLVVLKFLDLADLDTPS